MLRSAVIAVTDAISRRARVAAAAAVAGVAIASSVAAASAVAAESAAAAAAPARARPETVRFTFGWPAGHDVQVRAEKSLTRNAAPTTRQVTEYRLYVKPDADGFRIAPGDFERLLPGPTPAAPPRREPIPFMQARAAAPVFRVDPSGRFQTMADLRAARTAVARSAKDTVDRLGLADEFADDDGLLEAEATPELVERIARDYWEPIAGQWAGAELALDREYEFDTEVPLAIFGSVSVPAKRKVYVHRAPDCERDGVRRRCVYVETSITTGPGALEAAINGAVGGAIRVQGGPIASASMHATATLLIEPDGLVPHEYEYENAVRYASSDELASGEVSNIESERRRFRFVRR